MSGNTGQSGSDLVPTLAGGSLNIQVPNDLTDPDVLASFLYSLVYQLTVWSQEVALGLALSMTPNAATGARPTAAQLATLPNSGIGFSMLDTTLAKPIWWDGAHFRDATGSIV
jgi:hypothetical protein